MLSGWRRYWKERKKRTGYGRDISTPWQRLRSRVHFELTDHGILRHWWWNWAEIAPGVFRSNQPSPRRLAWMKVRGIDTVLCLRAVVPTSPILFEQEACEALGIAFRDVSGLASRELPTRETLIRLEQALRDAPRPFVMHCKSGADRSGLAAALFLILVEGRPVEEAQEQMSLRYAHLERSRAGVLGHILRHYLDTRDAHGMAFRQWMHEVYTPEDVAASFAQWRARR